MKRAVVTGIAHAVPPKVLTNDDLAKIVETSDEWIAQRTGIRERHICEGVDEGTYSLSVESSRKALAKAGVGPEDIDLVIVGTVSGDFLWPATACHVQNALGVPTHAAAFDISAACTGFVYGVSTATAFLESGAAKRALVVGMDCLSKQLNWEDRSTCILFGDGGGAMVLEAQESADDRSGRGVIKSSLFSDGSGSNLICVETGGTKYPLRKPHPVGIRETIFMAGNEVYRFAIGAMADACNKLLAESGFRAEDIALFVPHQANIRIIQKAAEAIGISMDKVYINVDRYGNTSAGSIPLALSEAAEERRIRPGDLVMTVGFGAGLTWGANLIRW